MAIKEWFSIKAIIDEKALLVTTNRFLFIFESQKGKVAVMMNIFPIYDVFLRSFETIFFLWIFADHENSLKIDSRDEVGVDVDNDDDLPMVGDIDSGDHDSNDLTRPRKIRR